MARKERLLHAGSCACEQTWRRGRAGMAQRQSGTFHKLQRSPAASSSACAAGNTLRSFHEPTGGQHCGFGQRVRVSRLGAAFRNCFIEWRIVALSLLCQPRRRQERLVPKMWLTYYLWLIQAGTGAPAHKCFEWHAVWQRCSSSCRRWAAKEFLGGDVVLPASHKPSAALTKS